METERLLQEHLAETNRLKEIGEASRKSQNSDKALSMSTFTAADESNTTITTRPSDTVPRQGKKLPTGVELKRRRGVKLARRIVESRPVEHFLTLAIMANLIVLASEHHDMDPSYSRMLRMANAVLTLIFLLETLLKLVAYSVRGYMREAYNVFDMVVVLSSVVELLLDSSSVSVLRTFRIFRIMRSVRLIKAGSALRFVLDTAVASLAAVASFGALLMLIIYLFALIGMDLFGGKLISADEGSCSTGQSTAEECSASNGLWKGDVPRANYDNFIAAFLSVFQVATRENWTVLLFDAMAYKISAAVAFYILLVGLSNYVLLALFMGTVLEKFQKEYSAELDRRKPHVSFGTASKIILAKQRLMAAVQNIRLHPSVAKLHMPTSLCIFDGNSTIRNVCIRITHHVWFEGSVLAVIAVSGVVLAVEHPNDVSGTNKATALFVADVVITACFTIELLIVLISHGLVGHHRAFLSSYWNILDALVVGISIAILFWQENKILRGFRVLRSLRVLRMLQNLDRWPNLRTVVSSLVFSLPSIATICALALFFMTIMA
jgi:hypothetical protein